MSKQTTIKWWLAITVTLIISMVASTYYNSEVALALTSAGALVSFGGVMTYLIITQNVKPTSVETKTNKLHLLSIQGSVLYASTSSKPLAKVLDSLEPDIISRGGSIYDVDVTTITVEMPLVPNQKQINYEVN